ncbi:DUF2949 domain-containing protein [Ancylothrix sp. C2]|uniref:DUF2949 domain-containing protein n=1 Tax=Ancylothrix sp. D3o TaxID=2953691 RepID=UPI0021BADDF4|nr:DUF2949 domain-containing protein [Ancylothrix sp. D3o]MCT7949119.1 DUF2949 domain-containing protein [Ancylothrix sp. D3o]
MQFNLRLKLIEFLQEDLGISNTCIELALRSQEPPTLLPMVLWQYGLVSIEQLERIFDWLEAA